MSSPKQKRNSDNIPSSSGRESKGPKNIKQLGRASQGSSLFRKGTVTLAKHLDRKVDMETSTGCTKQPPQEEEEEAAAANIMNL